MIDKKGYGLIILEDLTPESWEGLTPQQMLSELKDYNVEAFYRMAVDAGIDVALLDKSGYDYDGFSQLALMELEAFKGEETARHPPTALFVLFHLDLDSIAEYAEQPTEWAVKSCRVRRNFRLREFRT